MERRLIDRDKPWEPEQNRGLGGADDVSGPYPQILISPIDKHLRLNCNFSPAGGPQNQTRVLMRGTPGKLIYIPRICVICIPLDQADFYDIQRRITISLLLNTNTISDVEFLLSTPFQENWITELLQLPLQASDVLSVNVVWDETQMVQHRYLYFRYKGLRIPEDIFQTLTPIERIEICRTYLRI